MKNKNMFIVMILIVILFNSIVYSALNSEMFINGDAHIRVEKDIRITDVKVLEQTNGSYETYNSDYSKNTTSMQVTLPSSESVMVYEVTITNKGSTDYEVTNIVEESYSNNNIKYELIDIEDGSIIDRGTTHKFKIKFTTTENNPDNKTTLVLKYNFKEWVPSLYNMVAHKSKALDTDIDFGVAPTKETSGVYKMNSTKDDEYSVYYYRGIIDNNNVSFAGFCWKIVRTTSTGGVKLIYNGVVGNDGNCDNTGAASQIKTSYFNTSHLSPNDASYQYDDGTDSTIKKEIDKWYSENMIEYTNMLEDEEWCNDRKIYKTSGNKVFFGANYRNVEHSSPDILCPNDNDKFTVSTAKGNGKLTYPVALITADEITLAGHGYKGYTNLGYLNSKFSYWSLSPNAFPGSQAGVISLHESGFLGAGGYVEKLFGIRPMISLASGTMIKEGNGSVTNPYKLVEDKITKEWTFDYTGGEQEFVVPYDGIYKLEVWGAQGGSYNEIYYGGYGGYATGSINFIKGQKLYVNVGGVGERATVAGAAISGGYNGGGGTIAQTVVKDHMNNGGGGATHIASCSGLLSTLYNKRENILIASGGGGGGFYHTTNSLKHGFGGSGGGIKGNDAIAVSNIEQGYGGTQNSGGKCSYNCTSNADFGIGATWSFSAGGGGFYGGGPGMTGGGGGSGYISNSLLNNKVMYCYECQESNEESTKTISTTNVSEEPISNYAKKENGYAKITLIAKK